MKAFMIAYDKSYEHYGRMYAALMKYEDTAIDYYADGEINARNITHPGATDVKDSILTTIDQWKNPYRDAYIWIKGEMLDLLGMMDAMDGREEVLKAQMSLESNKRDKQVELEKMSLGKTTLKSFFKSKGTIEKNILSYQADVEAANHEIEEYRKLINFITIYHGHLAIDAFKRNKQGQYQKMLNTFSVREISNAHLSATLYHSLLELNEKK